MTALLVVAVLCILALLAYGLFREPADRSASPPAAWTPPSRPPARVPTGRRFSGRVVEAEPIARRPVPQPARRMQNGVKVAAVKNGREIIPPDAIGLGCLQPISECRLGNRCVCLNQNELRMESRL
jgi:hypothetical protein